MGDNIRARAASDSKDKTAGLTKDASGPRNKSANLDKEVRNLKAEISGLKREIDNNAEVIMELTRENSEKSSEIEKKTLELSDLNVAMTSLLGTLDTSQEKETAQTKELKETKAQVEELKVKIKELEVRATKAQRDAEAAQRQAGLDLTAAQSAQHDAEGQRDTAVQAQRDAEAAQRQAGLGLAAAQLAQHDAEAAQHTAEEARSVAVAAKGAAEHDRDEAGQAHARAEGRLNGHNFAAVILATRLGNINAAIVGVGSLGIGDAQEAAMYTEMLQRVKAATEREIAEQATVAEHAALVQAQAAFANAQLRLAALGLNPTVATINIALGNINVDVIDINERAVYQQLLENERALAQAQADLTVAQALAAQTRARQAAELRFAGLADHAVGIINAELGNLAAVVDGQERAVYQGMLQGALALAQAQEDLRAARLTQHNAEGQQNAALLAQQNAEAARLAAVVAKEAAERDRDEARQAYARAEGKFNGHNFPVEVNLAARLHNIEVTIAGVSALHIADAQEAAMYTGMLQQIKAATECELVEEARLLAEQATVAEHAALVQAQAAFANAQLRLAALGLNPTVATINIALGNINVDVIDINERAIYQRLLENERALAQTQADLAARQAALTAEQAARVGAERRAHDAEEASLIVEHERDARASITVADLVALQARLAEAEVRPTRDQLDNIIVERDAALQERNEAVAARFLAEQATVVEHIALVQVQAAFANAQHRLAVLGLNPTIEAIDTALSTINTDVVDVHERDIYQYLLQNARALAQAQAGLLAEHATRVRAEQDRATAVLLAGQQQAIVLHQQQQLEALPGLQAAASEGYRAARFISKSKTLVIAFQSFKQS